MSIDGLKEVRRAYCTETWSQKDKDAPIIPWFGGDLWMLTCEDATKMETAFCEMNKKFHAGTFPKTHYSLKLLMTEQQYYDKVAELFNDTDFIKAAKEAGFLPQTP